MHSPVPRVVGEAFDQSSVHDKLRGLCEAPTPGTRAALRISIEHETMRTAQEATRLCYEQVEMMTSGVEEALAPCS